MLLVCISICAYEGNNYKLIKFYNILLFYLEENKP